MENKEKKVTIGIDVKGKNFNHKAKHAMTTLRNNIQKHFRSTDYVISPAINELIWAKGRANTPSKVSIVGVEKNAKVYLFLDSAEDLKRKDELLSGKKGDVKDEKKASSKKDEKIKEHKQEDYKENKKEDASKKTENDAHKEHTQIKKEEKHKEKETKEVKKDNKK